MKNFVFYLFKFFFLYFSLLQFVWAHQKQNCMKKKKIFTMYFYEFVYSLLLKCIIFLQELLYRYLEKLESYFEQLRCMDLSCSKKACWKGFSSEMENISRGPTFRNVVTIRTERSMQQVTVARLQSTRVQTTISPFF